MPNNQYEKYPVSTCALTFFSDNMMMLMNFTDDRVHISFRDAVIDEDGKRRYPRPASGDDKNSIMLTKDRVVAFLNRIENKFIPKFESFIEQRQDNPTFNTGYSVGIATNTDMTNMLTLNTGKPEAGAHYAPELCYYKGISMETRQPAETKVFKFSSKIPVFTDYDPSTGNYASQFPEYPQLLIFKAALDDFVTSQSKGVVHTFGMKYHDQFSEMKKLLQQVAIKVGVPVPQNTRPAFNNNTQEPPKAFDANTSAPAELKVYDSNTNLLNMVGDELPY